MNNDYMIIAFGSTHQAIRFERLLISHYAIELIPTPRDVSASCGLSLKFEVDDLEAIQMTLMEEDKTGLQLLMFKFENENHTIIPIQWRL